MKSSLQILPTDWNKYSYFRSKLFHAKSDIPLFYKDSIQDKFSVEEKKIINLFKSQLNEVANSIEVVQIKSTFHKLYKVHTTDKEYILKVHKLNNLYTDFPLYLDYYIQNKLHKLNLPYIHIYKVDCTKKIIPFDYMIMEYKKGENLESYQGGNKSTIYYQLGEIFKHIHTLPVNKVGHINFEALLNFEHLEGMNDSWDDFLFLNLESHLNTIVSTGVVNGESRNIIEKLFINNRQLFSNGTFSFLHNDPGTRNIITDGEKIVAILDWEDSIIGDTIWEIAFIDTFLFRDSDQELFKQFCDGYQNTIEELYKSKKYWLYYLRIAMLKTISRFFSGYYDQKGKEVDIMRIQKALRHLL